jgi:hypothetical protein
MKIASRTLLILACGLSLNQQVYSAENITGLGDVNPFLVDEKQHKNSKIEPRGVVVYSFSKNPNKITGLESDRTYVQEAQSTRNFGYATVPAARIRDFATLVHQHKDSNTEFRARLNRNVNKDKFANEISPLSTTAAFSKADMTKLLATESTLIFESAGGNFFKNKGWDSTTRIYNDGTFGTIIISEWDFSLSNGGVITDKDAVNFYVNGNPAILIVREDNEGRAETVLSWADTKKSYSIEFDKNLSKEGLLEQVKFFAESLSDQYY